MSVAGHLRANVVGYLALAIALSGAAYAAGLPKNSVGSAQLKDGAVTTADVKDGNLQRRDFKAGQLPRPVWVGVKNLVSGSGTPVAVPDQTSSGYPFTIPAGKAAEIELFLSRPIGACNPAGAMFGGVYLDGQPVADTQFLVPSSNPDPVVIRAVRDITPGQHELKVGVDCASGTVFSLQISAVSWRVARVGS